MEYWSIGVMDWRRIGMMPAPASLPAGRRGASGGRH